MLVWAAQLQDDSQKAYKELVIDCGAPSTSLQQAWWTTIWKNFSTQAPNKRYATHKQEHINAHADPHCLSSSLESSLRGVDLVQYLFDLPNILAKNKRGTYAWTTFQNGLEYTVKATRIRHDNDFVLTHSNREEIKMALEKLLKNGSITKDSIRER